MLPKSKRLTKADFKGLKTRIVYRGACFDLAAEKRDINKFACIVSKKRMKRSVDRNKARRKIYSALEEIEPTGTSYVLIYPNKQVLSSPLPKIVEELSTAFATL